MKNESFTVLYFSKGKKLTFDWPNAKKTRSSACRYAKQIILEGLGTSSIVVDDRTGKAVKAFGKHDVPKPVFVPGNPCPLRSCS